MNCEFCEPKLSSKQEIYELFKIAPDCALFDQYTVAALRDCSIATTERDRWAGTGVPFVKCGRSVRYRKKDIVHWLEKQRKFSRIKK